MACRKHSPGKACCGTCVDSTSLPTSVTFGTGYYSGTVATADWTSTDFSGTASACCWYAVKHFATDQYPSDSNSGGAYPNTATSYEYQCSAAYGLPGPSFDRVLVNTRWKLGTYFIMSKQTCVCDGGASSSQYVFYVSDLYVVKVAAYYDFGYPCSTYGYNLATIGFGGQPVPPNYGQFYQAISRKFFFPTASTASYVLTTASTASCNDTCETGGYTQNTMSYSLTLGGITRTLTWEDNSDWTIGITY